MTARQREVLDALAHVRLPRDEAWLTTNRVNIIVGRTGVSARGVLGRLVTAGLVERETTDLGRHLWRITDKGREVL